MNNKANDKLNDILMQESFEFIKQNIHEKRIEIDDSDLLDDIKLSIEICRENINNNKLPFEIFSEYVLPPIIDCEPYEKWKEDCYEEFKNIPRDSIGFICDTLNMILSKHFKFNNITSSFETKNWSYYKNNMTGDCFDMTKVVTFPLRSLGYATTTDYTLAWGNVDGAHSWNVIYDMEKKKMIPFMGLEQTTTYNPFIIYNCITDSTKSGFRYPAKVFRKTFSINQKYKTIYNHFLPNENSFFRNLYFKDVTSEYFDVANLSLSVERRYVNSVLFLCVYNRNKWIPISANICDENNNVMFGDINKDLLYILSDGTGTISHPFILLDDSQIRVLEPSKYEHIDLNISYTKSRVEEYMKVWGNLDNLPNDIFQGIVDNYYRDKPINGEKYQLYIYNNGWLFISETKAENNTIIFSQIPNNGLYLIKNKEKVIGRPFTYEDSNCIWW